MQPLLPRLELLATELSIMSIWYIYIYMYICICIYIYTHMEYLSQYIYIYINALPLTAILIGYVYTTNIGLYYILPRGMKHSVGPISGGTGDSSCPKAPSPCHRKPPNHPWKLSKHIKKHSEKYMKYRFNTNFDLWFFIIFSSNLG